MGRFGWVWIAVLGVVGQAATGCGADDAVTCYDGCSEAADRAACVAACDAADPTADGGGQADATDPDADGQGDAGQDAAGSDAGDDAGSDADDDAGDSAGDGATDPDGGDVPLLEPIWIVDCQALLVCYAYTEADSASGEACFGSAIPELEPAARAAIECGRARCAADAGDPFAFLTCVANECGTENDACEYIPLLVPECIDPSRCLEGCDLDDDACRSACLDTATSDTGAELALGYHDCVNTCYANFPAAPEECVALDCASIDVSCYGADPGWNCAETYGCLLNCGDDVGCTEACNSASLDLRSRRAADALLTCAVAAGCVSDDPELDMLCRLERCGTLETYCSPI